VFDQLETSFSYKFSRMISKVTSLEVVKPLLESSAPWLARIK